MANKRFIDFPIATTVGDNDIILIWQGGANKQTTKATILSGVPDSLNDLTDVTISGLTNGQILRYDSVTGQWENTDQGNLDLNDLNDVTIVSPTNGQVLVYNSSTSKWENSSGGYVPYVGAVTTVNLGAQSIQAGSFVKQSGTSSQFLKADGSVDSTAYGTGSVTSVGLTMPAAFNVANSPITTAGTLAVTGAGTVAQYIRGDGSLADFPETSGGGSSVSYYLNGSVSQGTIGGVAYREMNKVPILGAGTDFTINANGYIASFITDAGDPNLLEIPGGNWNFETYFSSSSNGGTPTFYVELYKVNSGGTATLIASNSAIPEFIAFGTNITAYFTTLAVPTTTLALTDRLAVRYYVTHSGRTITMHTEGPHLCQIITTFTTGLTALNGLTAQVQNFAVGTSGTDFNIASATATHTFNLPTASATNRGALSSADWSLFTQAYNDKINSAAVTGTTTKTLTLTQQDGGTITASWSDLNTDAVLSVFGRTGAVVAANGDYTTAQVTESGNLYYTDARSRAALSFAAGSGAYNTSTGVITIPTNNNQITNGAGYITSAALAGYLPLTGGTLTGPLGGTSASFSGDLTANRYRGVNSLVLNSYTTVNPSSNVYLYSPPSDRDAWIYLDSADTGSNWGIYHRQIDTAVSGLPANSIGFVGGGSSTLQAWISLANGNGYYAGSLITRNASTSASVNPSIMGGGEMMSTGSQAGYFWENRSGGVTSNSNWYGWYTSAGIIRLYNGSTDILEINGSSGAATFDSSVTSAGFISSVSTSGFNLDLNKSAGFGALIQLKNTSASSNELIRVLNSSNNIISQIFPTSNGIAITSGNVLIGTQTDNGNSLRVNGNAWFDGGINPTKSAKNTYAIHIKGSLFGAPRLQLYDLAADPNAFVGLGVDMSGAPYEFSNYFPRTAGLGRWSVGSWAGDFGTGQYVSGYNEKLFITESVAQFNVPLQVGGTAYVSNTLTTDGSLIVRNTNISQASILRDAVVTNGTTIGILRFGARFNSTTYGTGADISTSAVGTWSSSNYGTNLVFSTVTQNTDVNTARMTILHNGNVGIGTPSPSEKLDVVGGGLAAGNGTIKTGITYSSLGLIGTFSNHDLGILTNGSIKATITSSGNVGIGVTPNSWGGTNVKALEVYLASMSASLSYGTAFTFNTFYDTAGNWKYIGPYTAGKYEIGGDEHIWYNAPSGSAGATATFTPRMKITSGGNVLIGTTTDNGRLLRVNGRSYFDSNMMIAPQGEGWGEGLSFTMPNTNTWGGLRWRRERGNNDGNFYVGYTALDSTDDLVFGANNGGAQVDNILRLVKTGDVRIGTSTIIGPVQGKLDILYPGVSRYGMNIRTSTQDGIAISFVNSVGSQVGNIYTNFSSTAYNTSSDYRLKEDLKEFNGIDLINKIKTYDFKWKSDNSRSYGVVAHELQEVINYAVYGQKDSVTMQGVDYSKLVPILIKAIQEQQIQIDKLKN